MDKVQNQFIYYALCTEFYVHISKILYIVCVSFSNLT